MFHFCLRNAAVRAKMDALPAPAATKKLRAVERRLMVSVRRKADTAGRKDRLTIGFSSEIFRISYIIGDISNSSKELGPSDILRIDDAVSGLLQCLGKDPGAGDALACEGSIVNLIDAAGGAAGL